MRFGILNHSEMLLYIYDTYFHKHLIHDFSSCLWSQNLNHKLYIFDYLVHELLSYGFSNFLCCQMLFHIYDTYFQKHQMYDFSTCLWSQNFTPKFPKKFTISRLDSNIHLEILRDLLHKNLKFLNKILNLQSCCEREI